MINAKRTGLICAITSFWIVSGLAYGQDSAEPIGAGETSTVPMSAHRWQLFIPAGVVTQALEITHFAQKKYVTVCRYTEDVNLFANVTLTMHSDDTTHLLRYGECLSVHSRVITLRAIRDVRYTGAPRRALGDWYIK